MKLSRIYVDQAVSELPETASFLSALNCPVELVSGSHPLYEAVSQSEEPATLGKSLLYLAENKGPFLKDCPGTSHYTCCNYRILHIGSYCSMDCSYCILQAYFHPPVLQFFINHDDLHQELDAMLAMERIHRIGTGEFTDSLIWEDCSDLTQSLVDRFGRQDHAVLELKTKTDRIQNLRGLAHRRKTILAWSLNAASVVEQQERSTANLAARLAAARQCADWGYPLAFHFDPLILFEGCENEYLKVLELLFAAVAADQIVWISLGSLRFMPELKAVLAHRFPSSNIAFGEFVAGKDAKLRYFKPLRVRLYRTLIEAIRSVDSKICIYFCMEDDEVWERAMGFQPAREGGLPHMLDRRAAHCCGLKTGRSPAE